MRKTLYLAFFLSLFIAIYFVEINKDIEKKLLNINEKIKIYYVEKLLLIENFLTRHHNQSQTIEELQKQILITKMNSVPLIKLQKELENIQDFDQNYILNSDVTISRTLHFKNIYDQTQLWMDYQKDSSNINGLISYDMVAGIVKEEKGKALALLNQNPNCNYGVFVGDDKAIGIVHGIKNSQNILVKFIPSWNNIKVNDEVYTNGLDNIFFEGLKVGRVLSIEEKNNHKEALVKPYSSSSAKKYYYIYNHNIFKNLEQE